MFSFLKKKETPPNNLTAEEIVQRATEGDNWYFGKNGYPVDKLRAFACYEEAGALGNIYAQLMAGYMLDFGDGVSSNTNKAIQWYTKASNGGDANATLNLANIYLLGRGTTVDRNKGCDLLRKAADLGSALAASSLGREYTIGESLPLSLADAEYWINKAESQGYINSPTITNLGLLYEREKKYEKAFECFSKAVDVDPNDTNSQYLYAQYKFYGRGTKPDLQDAKSRLEWVVRNDPSDQDACNLLQVVTLKEKLLSSLELTRPALQNMYQIWNYDLTIFVCEWGFRIKTSFAGNNFESSINWTDFASNYEKENDNNYSENLYIYTCNINLSNSLELNRSITKSVLDSLNDLYPYMKLRYYDNYASLTWRLDY